MNGIGGAATGAGMQAAASALGRVDLGEGKSDLLAKRVAEMTGGAQAKALAAVVKTMEENLGTILDLKG